MVKNNSERIKDISDQIQASTKVATEAILQLKISNTEKLNKKRISKSFMSGDIIFVVDSSKVLGNSRMLKTKLSPSPYVVITSLWTTTVVKRIADGFSTLYHNSMIKKYDKTSQLFATLPAEVTHVLLHKFSDFLDKDFRVITYHDPLERELGIQLYNPEDDGNENTAMHENVKELEMLENEYFPLPESESSPPKD